MSTLLSFAQQNAVKKISSNNQAVFDSISTEVEENEIKELLGIAFLQSLQDAPATAANVKILNGSTYVDGFGNTIRFKGLRYIMSYLVYSKYVSVSDITDTFTGMVLKNRDEATSLPEGRIKRLQEDARKAAFLEWDYLQCFIELNIADYPKYCRYKTNTQIYTPKITGVKKTFR